MKKLLFFIGLLSVSLLSFGQYTEDKLPSGLTVATSLAANDYQIVQKTGESYVKAIKAYHAYLYYKKMLDSIVNLTIAGNLSVGDDVQIAGTLDGSLALFTTLQADYSLAHSLISTDTIYTQGELFVEDTVHFFNKTYLPEWGYAMVLDTTDYIVKLAPMPDGVPDFNNVAYVNYDLTGDLESQLIFDSYASAVVWINANGSPTADNHWTIVMPSGYCDEEIVADEFIDIQGHVGTVISTVSSKVVSTGENIYDVTIKNCIIDTLWIDEGKILTLRDCIINTVQPVDGAGTGYIQMDNCTILGGDFSNTSGIIPWTGNEFIAMKSDIESMISLSPSTSFYLCEFVSSPTDLTYSIAELPERMNNCRARIEQSFEMPTAPYWNNSTIKCINTITFADGANIYNCNMEADTIEINKGNFIAYNSSVSGAKVVISDATMELHQSASIGDNINLYDTATLKIYDGSEIEGDVTQDDPTTAINDYRSAYAEIYYADASTAQSIPTGTTYTKWTAFTNDGEENNCTADAANDKITITEAGVYAVQGNFSSSCGTNTVVLHTALFVGGVEVSKIHKIATFSVQNNSQSGSISGLIYVAPADVPVDIDIRLRHDNVGSVNFTGIYGNLTVYKISEY